MSQRGDEGDDDSEVQVIYMSKNDDNFKTPQQMRTKSFFSKDAQPSTPTFLVPPSPRMKQLGYGTGVNVFLMERFSPMRGCYKSPWAVKKINSRLQDETKEYCKRLSYEACILKSLKHPNIIGYRTYTTSKDGTQCLAMESGEKSLSDLIETQEEKELGPFSPQKILKVAKDVASALKYLHEDKRILHGDLKSANILILGDFKTAKLCDFGVSLKLNDKGVVASNDDCYIGTECWSAPEAIYGNTISHKTDMFAFGLVLWEMISLSPPHVDKLSTDSIDEVVDEETRVVLEMEREDSFQKALGTRPALPDVVLEEEYLPILELFYACTESDPERRPSAGQVLHVMDCLEDLGKDKTSGGEDSVVNKTSNTNGHVQE
ncbi:lymphokine-activated killer T-cell-originated protein kinase-like [Penaeus japonicus]|uniref:lymphokine-activated killer T-cell-originated protein kinase-like n=1 Tax=Penaeus japonicus TaxID=27405 RepID=UPI001C715CF5|nr:lymphokine-activated killer T-cell-originated protein kinase-like [Penaeus japonicus]